MSSLVKNEVRNDRQHPLVGPEHPCYFEGEIDHEWEFVDDSFDHEFGTERVHYWRCSRCDATREMEAGDYDDDY